MRAFSEDGEIDTPKSGHGRTVDTSCAIAYLLGMLLMPNDSIAVITEEGTKEFYGAFLEALRSGDIEVLKQMYADDYILVRPQGDTLRKSKILEDLQHHSMRFLSFELHDCSVRTKGPVGIITADVRITTPTHYRKFRTASWAI